MSNYYDSLLNKNKNFPTPSPIPHFSIEDYDADFDFTEEDKDNSDSDFVMDDDFDFIEEDDTDFDYSHTEENEKKLQEASEWHKSVLNTENNPMGIIDTTICLVDYITGRKDTIWCSCQVCEIPIPMDLLDGIKHMIDNCITICGIYVYKNKEKAQEDMIQHLKLFRAKRMINDTGYYDIKNTLGIDLDE